jgi:CBS domain containing-hemolysin-like protein
MAEYAILVLIVTVLILLNGLYVAAEFAVISLPKIRLEQEAAGGDVGAERYLGIISNSLQQDRFIAIAQMGITLASLGLGMYGEHALAGLIAPYLQSWGGVGVVAAHSAATVISLLFLTFWHIVAGEMVPKSLALLYPVQTAKALWWPMRVSGVVLAPLGWVLNGLGNMMLRLLGLPVSHDLALVYSPDELRMVFEESRNEGLLPPEQHQMLENVIDFGERPLRLIMVPRTQIVGLPVSATVADAVALLEAEEYSRYPLYQDDLDNIVSFVHVKDVFAALTDGGSGRAVSEIAHPIIYLPETLRLDEAMDRLRESSAHMAVVVESRGGTGGIVTMEDLIEELFGEIRDEYDQADPPEVEALEQGVRVQGQMSLLDLEEALDTAFDRDDDRIETVAGLLLDALGRIPEPGDVVEKEGFRFQIETVENMTVGTTLITPCPAPPEETSQ